MCLPILTTAVLLFQHSGVEKKLEKSIFFSSVVFFQSQAGDASVLEHRSPEPAASAVQKEPLQQIRYVCVWSGCGYPLH